MSPELLSELKWYMHVDGSADDMRIMLQYESTVQELEKAGIYDDGSAYYKRIAFEKVRCWYDNVPEPDRLQRIVNQAKLCADPKFIF